MATNQARDGGGRDQVLAVEGCLLAGFWLCHENLSRVETESKHMLVYGYNDRFYPVGFSRSAKDLGQEQSKQNQ